MPNDDEEAGRRQTPEQAARCQQWLDERNDIVTAVLDECMEDEREQITARFAKMNPKIALEIIKKLREVPPARIEEEGVDAIRKWIDDDNHFRVCHALAAEYEEALLRRYMPRLTS
jgi:hypothetical protein